MEEIIEPKCAMFLYKNSQMDVKDAIKPKRLYA